jgi:hypothetical protein
MDNTNSLDYMETIWNRINEARDDFKSFIDYEWNFLATITFHENYLTDLDRVDILLKDFFCKLRRYKKWIFSAFYIIPKSYINPVYNPHHVHILFLVFNEKRMTRHLIEECANEYSSFNKCVVYKLFAPEAGTNYLLKNKNLRLTDLDSVYFDFYREQLLRKYRNQTEYINDELRRAFEKKQNNL